MSETMVAENEVGTEYSLEDFRALAASYKDHKGIVDAASKFKTLDAAIAALQETWARLEKAYTEGSGYTPPERDGWTGLNTSHIAAGIMGRRASIGGIRKSLRDFVAVDK